MAAFILELSSNGGYILCFERMGWGSSVKSLHLLPVFCKKWHDSNTLKEVVNVVEGTGTHFALLFVILHIENRMSENFQDWGTITPAKNE